MKVDGQSAVKPNNLLQHLEASTQITALSQSSTSEVSVWLPVSPTEHITILHLLKNTKATSVRIMPKPVILGSMERQTVSMQKETFFANHIAQCPDLCCVLGSSWCSDIAVLDKVKQ